MNATAPSGRGPVESVACPDCDLLQAIPDLAPGDRARCARCAEPLATASLNPLDLPLALTLTAVIAYLVANTAPLMGITAVGRNASTTIIGGAQVMWALGEPITAMIVVFSAVLAPGLYLLFMLIVLVAARRPPAAHWVGEMLRWAHVMQPWAMLEVMLLGILVALIKIAELAMVAPGVAMYAVAALVVLFPAIAVTFDPREVWKQVAWDDGSPHAGAAVAVEPAP